MWEFLLELADVLIDAILAFRGDADLSPKQRNRKRSGVRHG
jgi:hypothetical protein